MTYHLTVSRPVGALGRSANQTSLLASPSGTADFAIGSLLFKLAISDERPYQRATATFRKDQFDSSQDVGEQSLTGWWKRGQLSFHSGAGVNFYEVLDGSAVSNRFKDSHNVVVSTPGQVTLGLEWPFIGISNAVYGTVTPNGGAVYLTSGGEVIREVGSPYSPGAGTAVGVAPGAGDTIYVATSANRVERTTTSLGAGTVLYTHDTSIARIWYAKGRLWVLDTASRLYQLAPNPTGYPIAIASGDLVCTFAETTGAWSTNTWHMAEGPSAVYLAHQSGVIYAVTIQSDGTLPTLAAPVEVARMPSGAPLRAFGYYLGYLCLQTSEGVRLASVASDGGIVLGPQFLTAAATGTGTVSGLGNKVYLAANDGVLSIDLSQPIADANLTFAWVMEHEGGNLRGCLTQSGRVAAYGTSGIKQSSSTASFGWIETGQHRFGTLEAKQFHTIRVLGGGSGGTITVSRVDSSGGSTSLYTLDVSSQSEVDLNLQLDEPVVSIGLRFDLEPDGSDAPILYGYQLRALPAPKRQRMVRVPLMLFDTEVGRPTRATGSSGKAWERLAALEELEANGTKIQFQDFRTGEAGTCFIEAVEHEGKTPPGVRDTGFGGIVYVTLRKL